MPPGDQIIINLTTPSSIAERGNIDNRTNRKANAQRQNAFQKFEFVSSEDAHRARSYAMRQSWRKRKQQQKVEKKGNDISERPARPLIAKPESKYAEEVSFSIGTVTRDYEYAAATMGPYSASNALDGDLEIFSEDLPTTAGVIAPLDAEYDSLDFSNMQLLEKPSVDIDCVLSPRALDPFDTFPIHLTTRHHELLHHWLSSYAAMMFEESPSMDFNPMRDVWFPLDLSNAASFYGILAHAAAHLSYLRGQKHATEVLKYKAEAVSLINKWMNDREMALSDNTFAAVVRLLTFERYWGTEEAWRIHRAGLEQMIRARGGMSSLKQNWRLGLVLQLISLMSKPSWFFPSNNISEISASISYLSSRQKTSQSDANNPDIQKLRSLWLISFIQDMRSLMANSSNLQSEGLRHYHALHEAVNILRASFYNSEASEIYEHDRIACLFYIGVMIQECVSSRYHNTVATVASETTIPSPDMFLDERSYDRLATLNSALHEQRSEWQESIPKLEAILLNHYMSQLGNMNRKKYVLHMTEVLTSLSREARNGVERCLLNMFNGRYGRDSLTNGTEGGWTVDQLLMSIHGQ